jgi:hypothetical protein
LKPEWCGVNTGSRREVPGERSPIIRDDDDDDDDDNNNNKSHRNLCAEQVNITRTKKEYLYM